MSLIPVAPLYLARSSWSRPLPRGRTGHVARPTRSIRRRHACHYRLFAADTAAATRLRMRYGRGKQLFSSCIVASFATYGSLRRAKSGLW